ncbi:NAD(P)-binding protein [Delitschia confertaspora ATCC 74209]|uniref:NAD(P)-binding protein n=1 Tax=Delitschia confertaspora ATCC 74209 TaxID=1513339 RepID=A0A9P4JL91_9PLEO|nr:NAD(P)-binding protein [Delitschia confertaspora ATCC 74209]
MAERPQTAYVTGGASGIGRALVEMLVDKGIHVFIADRDLPSARSLCQTLNSNAGSTITHCVEVDVSSYSSQLSAFQQAVSASKTIDFVFPVAGVGEKAWLPKADEMEGKGLVEPDLSVLDVDLKGVLWTVGLAVQQMKRQDKGRDGWRGKITCVSSICGLYSISTVPIYTAAKHGVVGFVRSYGELLPSLHSITLNTIAPNVVRTGISTEEFYERMEKEGLLVPMQGAIDAFAHTMESAESGEVYECGPNGGFCKREGVGYLDESTKRACAEIEGRARVLHQWDRLGEERSTEW